MQLFYRIFRRRSPTKMARYFNDRPQLLIKVKQGVVRGIEQKLPNNGIVYCFKGIPYAEPPIGNLRFEPPRPLLKFNEEVLDCSKERDICFHTDLLTRKTSGSEDCLYLNVYAPAQTDSKKSSLPVMIWIHGGAFKFGSGSSEYYSPEYLVQENVIVVTFNYRLSALGFLYLPEAGIYGNAALKDQRLVLKWVQENISHFGGDPNNVTLFGQSAGGVSAHIHSMSPASNKYFHKLICQSGVALNEWAIERNPEDKTRILAKLLGCQSNDAHEILAFLKSYDDLPKMIAQHYKTMSAEDKRRGFPLPFRPAIEIENPDAVITKWPLEMIQNDVIADMPMLIGYNSIEGLQGMAECHKHNRYHSYDNDLARCIPKSIDLAVNDSKCTDFADYIREFYFGGRTVSEQTNVELTKLIGDYHFNKEIQMCAEAYARRRQRKSPLYFYRFDCEEELNFYRKLVLSTFDVSEEKRRSLSGACHSDELYYLFEFKKIPMTATERAAKIRNKMCKLWTNFAKYGDPTPSDQDFSFVWTPMKKTEDLNSQFDLDYLHMDVERFRMERNPENDRMQFWRKMFDKYDERGFLKAKL